MIIYIVKNDVQVSTRKIIKSKLTDKFAAPIKPELDHVMVWSRLWSLLELERLVLRHARNFPARHLLQRSEHKLKKR